MTGQTLLSLSTSAPERKPADAPADGDEPQGSLVGLGGQPACRVLVDPQTPCSNEHPCPAGGAVGTADPPLPLEVLSVA